MGNTPNTCLMDTITKINNYLNAKKNQKKLEEFTYVLPVKVMATSKYKTFMMQNYKFISVGTVTQRESSQNMLKKIIMILLTMAFLSNCTKLKFDGFDPTTAPVRWIIQNEKF